MEYPVVTRVRRICTSWGTTWREGTALLGVLPNPLNLQPHANPTAPLLLAQGLPLSPAHLSKVLEGRRASFTELRDQRDGAQQDAWCVGGGVDGGPGAQESLRRVCVHVHMLPFSSGLMFLSHFSLLSTARGKAGDGEPRGLTVVAFMKQLGTGWEEDVGELGDLPDHVHCSQNSLQRSGGSERGGGLPGWTSHL